MLTFLGGCGTGELFGALHIYIYSIISTVSLPGYTVTQELKTLQILLSAERSRQRAERQVREARQHQTILLKGPILRSDKDCTLASSLAV